MTHTTADRLRGPSFPGCDSWVEIGEVVRPHSLRGTLLVSLYGDDPENLIHAGRVLLRGAPGAIEFRFGSASTVGSPRGGRVRVRLQLAAIETREQAELWAGARLSIPESALQRLPEGEYYWRDLLGLRCRTVDGEEIGVVEEIQPGGDHDLLLVRHATGTLCVPALRRVLVRVDRERGELWIDPPEGLLEAGS